MVILSVLDPRKCEYFKDYSLDFEHAYMTTYLASWEIRMSTLLCRSLTGWVRHFLPRDFEYSSLSGNLQRICGSTWWWRAPKRLFSARWSHMPHLEWEHDRNRKFFDDRIISKALWPPRSPDLSPPDFFPVGRLKRKTYANKPRTI